MLTFDSRTLRACLMPGLVLAAGAAHAEAFTLNFGNDQGALPMSCTSDQDGTGPLLPCGSGRYLSQSLGDVAGVVDLHFSAPREPEATSLQWWGSGYSELFGVAYATGSDASSRARIEFKPINPADNITLSSFQLGAYPGQPLATQVNIYAIGSTVPLFSFNGIVGTDALANVFTPNVTVQGGLWLEWADSAYNVGIDNIQYSVSTIPEPASVLLMLGGALALGSQRRRLRACTRQGYFART